MDTEQLPWKTNDMALAAYLRYQGLKEKVIWNHAVCFWLFQDSDELQKHVIAFAGGQARVDPREYNKTFFLMKQEMYLKREQTESASAARARRNKG